MPTPSAPAPARSDSPATALGPTSLVLGVIAAAGFWYLLVFALPWSIMAGGLAVWLGLAGVHHARLGVGRMWMSVAGAVLGATALIGTFSVFLVV